MAAHDDHGSSACARRRFRRGLWMKPSQPHPLKDCPGGSLQRVDGEVAFSDSRANSDANKIGQPPLRINLLQGIGSTHGTTRTPRSLLGRISRGLIQTPP
jgi:hypothetical protein